MDLAVQVKRSQLARDFRVVAERFLMHEGIIRLGERSILENGELGPAAKENLKECLMLAAHSKEWANKIVDMVDIDIKFGIQ